MSDYIVKIIPDNPHICISAEKGSEVLRYLREYLAAERVELRLSDTCEFVDCGENLEKISCPTCGAEIAFDWWGNAMGIASESGFKNLSVTMPCCGKSSSLNDLRYYFPCGFSCVEFNVLNPTEEISAECFQKVEEMLGMKARLIRARL